MKYKTITFDANRPVAKQITEPLDSDYGIAVKVYKDGQPISADLSIGETICTEGPDGWKFAELSTGSTPCQKQLEVLVSKDADTTEIVASHEEQDSWGGGYTVQVRISLTTYAGLELTTETLQPPSGNVTSEFPDAQPTVTDWNNGIIIYTDGSISHPVVWSGGVWQGTGATLTEDAYLTTSYDFPQSATKSTLNFNIPVSTGEAFETVFLLYVQEKDLGYIEVKDISEEPVES